MFYNMISTGFFITLLESTNPFHRFNPIP